MEIRAKARFAKVSMEIRLQEIGNMFRELVVLEFVLEIVAVRWHKANRNLHEVTLEIIPGICSKNLLSRLLVSEAAMCSVMRGAVNQSISRPLKSKIKKQNVLWLAQPALSLPYEAGHEPSAMPAARARHLFFLCDWDTDGDVVCHIRNFESGIARIMFPQTSNGCCPEASSSPDRWQVSSNARHTWPVN